MDLTAKKITAAAAALESGKIKTQADLDKVLDKAAHAEMEHRWLVTDVTMWYPGSRRRQDPMSILVNGRAEGMGVQIVRAFLRGA